MVRIASPAAILTKRCSKCGVEKPVDAFTARATSRDGLHGWCRPCKSAYALIAGRRWRERNRERDRENQRRRYAANPERGRAYQRSYRSRHPERSRAQTRESIRRQYAANPAPFLARNNRRRVATAAATPEIVERVAFLLTQPCTYCGATEGIEIDHVVPLSRGGAHTVENLAAACGFCNRSKKDHLLSEWSAV